MGLDLNLNKIFQASTGIGTGASSQRSTTASANTQSNENPFAGVTGNVLQPTYRSDEGVFMPGAGQCGMKFQAFA